MNQPAKKILLVMPLSTTDWGSSNAGGVDSVCQMMAQYISENTNPEFHYRIVAISLLSAPKEFNEVIRLASNIELIWIPRGKKISNKISVPSFFYYIFKVRQQVKVFKPDIIHTHLWSTILGCSRSAQSVVTVHSYKNIARRSVSKFNDFLYADLIPRLYPFFGKKIVCVGEALKQAVSIDTTQSVISIGNPICAEFFHDNSLSNSNETLRLVTCALLTPRKQIEKTILLASALINKGVNCHLSIIGPETEANYVKQLKSLIQQEKIEKSVSFLGRLNKAQIISCYQESDIGLFFSKEETFGLAPLEMLATGLPVISTKVGVLEEKEQYFSDIGVLFVDVDSDSFLSDAVKFVESDKEVNVSSLKEKYAVSCVVAQYESVYRELLMHA